MSTRKSRSRRQFVVEASTTAAALSILSPLVSCGSGSKSGQKSPAFLYGVASGDPLTTSVMLWTHVKFAQKDDAVGVSWQVSTDEKFDTLNASGKAEVTAATDFTFKVDVTGLAPGTDYFYRFVTEQGVNSPVGITRTLPAQDVAQVKLAVFSCSLFSAGYFNAYEAASQSDAQYAVHLGDFIYEYGADPRAFGNANAAELNRQAVPPNETVSLADYRARYAQYRSDASLRKLLAKMPLIAVWDDHEFANNAYPEGAQNHDNATQGNWAERKRNAAQAHHEWMPIRSPDTANLLKIYRSFDFGRLLSLHMLDTRMDERARQYDSFGDVDGGIVRYFQAISKDVSGVVADQSRTLISAAQSAWLVEQMRNSGAVWQLLGNQDLMTKMWIPQSVLGPVARQDLVGAQTAVTAFLSAKATRFVSGELALSDAQKQLLDPAVNFRVPYNLDAWDGYPTARETLLQAIKGLNKNLVVLSGDSHNGWFGKVTTFDAKVVGVEFGVPSVTSPGFESVGLGAFGSSLDGSALKAMIPNAIGAGLGLIDDLGYADTARRGFLLATITADSVKGEYVYVSSVKSLTYTSEIGRTVTRRVNGDIVYT